MRQVRYIETKVGINPLQIDYKDYRSVNGVKLPYAWTVTWTNGQSTYEVGEFQANVAIDAAKFAKPAPGSSSSESSGAVERRLFRAESIPAD